MTLTFTRRNKQNTLDSLIGEPATIFRKMSKFNKFIIPLALVKIVLAFLVLQLFFSSCENEDYLYGSDVYTEGPVFEILASLGNENIQLETGVQINSTAVGDTANIIKVGDTLYLEIMLESSTLFDELSKSLISMNNPEYHAQFIISDALGNAVFPDFFEVSGNVDSTTEELFNASFGNTTPANILKSPMQSTSTRLKLGFVFDNAGSYTFYFVNTPNNLNSGGNVDIFYDRNPDNAKDVKQAYALYLFDLDARIRSYGSNDDSFKSDVLPVADIDQAIIDFIVIERN